MTRKKTRSGLLLLGMAAVIALGAAIAFPRGGSCRFGRPTSTAPIAPSMTVATTDRAEYKIHP